jgi:hypothetical protein
MKRCPRCGEAGHGRVPHGPLHAARHGPRHPRVPVHPLAALVSLAITGALLWLTAGYRCSRCGHSFR